MTVKKSVKLALVGFASCLSASFLTSKTLAQQSNIIPDNTLGTESSRLNRNIQINGINADTIDGGARRDSNLFHSFSEFNINDGQAVYFVNPADIQNILTRVTGANQSNIFGTLGVDGAANLFLINPNGIVFGENASLDLQGSFLGTTASGLQFGSQGNFSATNSEIPGNLTVNPSALFFNQVEASGGIINNSQAFAGMNPDGNFTTGLRVPDGKSLLLVGGDINFDGGRLRAYDGNIELASFTGEGTVGLNISGDTFSLNMPEDMERGDIFLTNESAISVGGAGGGNLTFNARNIEISNSFLFAGIAENSDNPNAQAGDINLNATDLIELKDDSSINNNVNSQGNAGNININARESVSLQGAGNFDSFDNSNDIEDIQLTTISSLVSPESIGNAGNIQLTTGTLSLSDRASIYSDTAGKGNAGNITINAGDAVSLDNISDIRSNVSSEGVGNGGNIRVTTKNLTLTNGSRISTTVLGEANAGNIFIEASDSVKLDGFFGNDNLTNGIVIFSGITSNFFSLGVGKGGDIQINTGNLSVSNLANISSTTIGQANAGNITINARDKVTFNDLGSAESAATDISNFFPEYGTVTVGNGGDIRIKAGELLLINGGFLQASNDGGKNAGNIFLDVRDTVTFDGVASNGINSNANTIANNGNAGNIEVKTGSLFLTNGGNISTALLGGSADEIQSAGDIKINARDTVKIDGEFSGLITNLLNGTGESGNIEIETKSLSITNDAQLSTISGGKGNAGDIKLTADTLFLDNSGFILTTTLNKGDAGTIDLNTTDSILLSNSSRISSDVAVEAEGKGGSININTQDLTLIDGSRITSSLEGKGKGGEINVNASESVNLSGIGSDGFSSGIFTSTGTAASGDAGDITVTTSNFRITDDGIISAETSNNGKAGNITFNANTFAATNGGGVTTTTFNSGKAGNINLNIKDTITLSGTGQFLRSGLFASTSPESTGKGGSIFIDPRLVIIENGAAVSVGSEGTGDAGDISLQAGTLQLNNGFITAQTASTKGGDINLQISELLLLRDESQITTTAGTALAGGDGGNIDINSKFIVSIPEENSDITANAFAGNGGKVNINSSGIFGIETQEKLTIKSDITASSETGISGETNINADDTSSIQNSFTELSPNIDTDAIIANSCIARGNKRQENSFRITGAGALPSNRPGNVLVSEYITGEVRNIDSFNQVWKKGDRIVEPQGLYRMKNGELLLSRECTN